MKKHHIAIAFVLVTVGGMSLLLGNIQQNLGDPGVLTGEGLLMDPEDIVLSTNCVLLPPSVGTFSGEDVRISAKTVEWLPPDTTFGFRRYHDDSGFEALAQVVLMGRDRTSIHKPEYCLYGAGWKITASETTTIQMSEPEPYSLPVTKISISMKLEQKDGTFFERSGYYYYWFISEDQMTATHKNRIVLMASDLLKKRVLKRWAYVSFLASAQPGVEESLDARLRHLIQQTVPQFQLTPPPDHLKITNSQEQ